MDILENDVNGNFFMGGPRRPDDSDGDSGSEDECAWVENLAPNLLQAGAEIRLPNSDRIGFIIEPADEIDENQNLDDAVFFRIRRGFLTRAQLNLGNLLMEL